MTRIWNYPGAFIAWGLSNETWSASTLVTRLHSGYGVRWLALEVPQPDGSGLVSQANQITGLRTALRAVGGCYFGIWQVDPWDTSIVDAIKPNFYIANIEGPAGQQRAAHFLPAFRAAHPKLPAGVVTNFGGIDSHAQAQQWLNADFVCLPEAYQNAQPNLTPVEMVFQATQRGWKEDDTFPVLGVWNGYGLDPYRPVLPRLRGWSVYGIETWAF